MKAKFLALAALLFGLAACQTDPQDLDVQMGGEQEVMLTVSLPETTRANSANGFDLNSLNSTNYSLRYILEIYRVEGEQVLYTTCQRFVETSDNTSMVFPVRLAPGYDYRIVAWADIIEENAADPKADRCYKTTDGLDAVEIIDGMWNPMDETRDAYTAVKEITSFSSSSELDMALTRPFAKVRVVATDIDDILKVGLKPTTATVDYSQDMYFKYNAVADIENKGVANDARAKSHNISYPDPATPVYNDATGELTLFADYIFVPESGTAKFSLKVYADENKSMLIKGNNFNTDIFVERNKLTTIKGDVLTIGGDVKVEVENDLGIKEEISYVDTIESLQDKINNAPDGTSTKIVLGGNVAIKAITRAESQYGLVIPAVKNIVLDLNGYTISQTKECTDSYSMIANNGNLTITGEGTIEFTNTAEGGGSGWGTYTIENRGEGVLTIDNATIRHNGCVNGDVNRDTNIAIQNYQGKVVINGGNIVSTQFRSLRDFTAGGEIIINGGTFLGQVWMQGLGSGSSSLTINGGDFTPVAGYDGSSVYISNNSNIVNVAVTGGFFNTKIGCNDATKAGVNGCIVGGTFTADAINNTNEELIAYGYKAVEENGVYVVRIPQELIDFEYAIANGEDVTLSEDLKLIDPIVVPEGKEVTIDLKGKTISGKHHKSVGAIIKNDGTLTIVGGTISSTGDNGGSAVMNNGILTIENATLNGAPNANGSWPSYTVNNIGTMIVENTTITSHHGAVASYGDGAVVTLNNCTIDMAGIPGFTSHGIYTYNNGKVVVNGGTYENKATDQTASGASVINGAVEVNAGTFSGRIENYYGTPVLKGGTFSVKPNANFIAAGYKAIEKNGKYYVVANEGEVVVSTPAEVLSAMKVAGQTVYIVPTTDGSAYKLDGKMSLAEGVKLIGMGDTPVALFNDWGSNAFANQAHFTNTYVENINFTNNLVIDAGIVTGDVKFVNCVFGGDLAHQGVHFDSGNGTLTFNGCTFVGRNMLGASIEKVTFNECYFENKRSSQTGADKWTGVNMWGKYEFNKCVFGTEAHCGVKCDGVVAAFNNCSFTDNRDITTIVSNSNNFTANIKFDGNKYISEGLLENENGDKVACSEAGLKAALKNGGTNILLKAGNYELSGLEFAANDVTLKGEDKASVVLNLENSIYLQNKSLTLENLTYNLNAGKDYTEQAFAFVHHATAFNLKNCNVNRLRLNVYEANIEDCTFTLNTSSGFDGYCIYYYGNDNSTVNVKNSTFATAGKGICIYSEHAKAYNLNVDKCSFTSSDSATDKAAIQMHTELGISGNVKITETTATGFANINGGLWNELNNNTKVATDKFDIWVDGTQVH